MLQILLLKKVVQKEAEATGDLVGNKIADKIISIGKTKTKSKKKIKQIKQKKFAYLQKNINKLLMI